MSDSTEATPRLGTKARRKAAFSKAIAAYNEAAARTLEKMDTPIYMDELFLKELNRRRDAAIEAMTGEKMESTRMFSYGRQPLQELVERHVRANVEPLIRDAVAAYAEANKAELQARASKAVLGAINNFFNDDYEIRKIIGETLRSRLRDVLQNALSEHIDEAVRNFEGELGDA